MSTDFRFLFTVLTTRKPRSWDDMALHHDLTPEHRHALAELPVVQTDLDPLEDFLGAEPPLECIVQVGQRSFYVNCEGYSYARYAFEFLPPSKRKEHP